MRLPGFSKETDVAVTRPSQLALRITASKIQGAIWGRNESGVLDVMAISSMVSYVEGDVDSLVTQADLVLGECIEQLPESVDEPHQVLFGLPSTWTVNGNPTEQARQFLRQMSNKLELQALGIVGNIEAIVNFLSVHNGVVSGILIGVDEDQFEIGVAAQGVVSSVASFKRSSDFVQDVKQAIADFKQTHLPPKIVIWGTDHDLTNLHQQLAAQPWQDLAVGFLHLPEVAILPMNLPLEAIIFATEPNKPMTAVDQPANDEGTSEDDVVEEATPPMEEAGESEDVQTDEDEMENPEPAEVVEGEGLRALGFVHDQDIREVTEDAFGDGVVVNTPTPAIPTTKHGDDLVQLNKVIRDETEVEAPQVVPPLGSAKKKKLKSLRWVLITVILLLVGLGVTGSLYALWAYSSASVEIRVRASELSDNFTVTLDTEHESVDVEAGALPAIMLEEEVEGSSRVNVTGKSTVGERAKGEVTIFNDTDVRRTLAAGTRLTTTNGSQLVFTLDTEVQIASKSVDLANENSPFSPGVATAKVTALNIGTDYNIGAQTPFNVANFSSSVLLARSNGAFSGGSSREVRVVAQVDIQAATEQLRAQLTEKAKSQMENNKDNTIEIIDDSGEVAWKGQSFSHKLNEETENLTMTGTLSYSAIGYSVSEMENLAKQKLQTQIDGNNDLAGNIRTQFALQEGNSEEGKYIFDVSVSARLVPNIVPDKIRERIIGNNARDMDLYMRSRSDVVEIETKRTPALPGWFNRYPPNADKIQITITTE